MANTSASPGTHVAAHLLSLAHPPTTASRIFTEKVKLRPLHLKPGENPTPSGRAYRRTLRLQAASKLKKKRKPQPLSAAEKRATGLHSIPSDQQKYAIFEPLHQLWTGYINEILGTGRPISGPVAAKLASADYHGALVQVARSRCTSRVGVKGIVVKDTKFTFEIITEQNELKVLPKEHTVFRFEVRDDADAEAEESKDIQLGQLPGILAVHVELLIMNWHAIGATEQSHDAATRSGANEDAAKVAGGGKTAGMLFYDVGGSQYG
ncbi:hypothetical protein O988_06815 [Pseudogymnoascus sp. VKM F-3808]|nr:hypothetical protein O988_06815 [Pseudogymnoascus sp. VKM F-3808]